MTTVIERSDTAVKERPRVRPPEPKAPRPRPRRAWYAWMVSLIVVAVAAVGLVIGLTGDDEAATIDYGSGESVYMHYDWYADLEGFYLPAPALASSGESAYLEYDWYADLGGFYLPKPYGDMTPDSHYSWLVERALIPEAYEAAPGFGSGEPATPGVDWYGERGDHRVG